MKLRRLTDRAGVLKRDDREPIQLAMGRFSKRFPQLFVAIHTGSPGSLQELRCFGFWLLNRSTFDDLPAGMSNEAGILLTIDPENKAAGLTFGYLLESYLTEEDTFDCLARAHGHWLEGRYADGIIRVLAHLEAVLIGSSRSVRRRHARNTRREASRKVSMGSVKTDRREVKS